MTRPLQIDGPLGAPAPAAATSDLHTAALLALLASGAAAFWFLPLGIEPQAQKALAVGLFMIAAWMTQVLDLGVTGILGCFLFWLLGIAKFESAFSGFSAPSAGFLSGDG